MPHRLGFVLKLVVALLALSLWPMGATAQEDPEQKVYEQAYGEVKSAFDATRSAFDNAYTPIKEAQQAIRDWRGAVTRAQQDGAIQRIEGMVASGMTSVRDEMVVQLLGEDALAALQKLEKITGTTIALPEPKKMLDMIRDPDDFANNFGYMYKLSQFERVFRDSRAAKALASAEAIFERGGSYLDRAGQMVDFVSLFDPNNNAADGPVGRLRSISAVLTTMQDIAGEIPGLGDLIGYYAEAAEAFAGSLTRLDAKLKDARVGSLCGQLGQLTAELAALDQHIQGGDCISYMTDYPLEAALKPLKVWEHFEYGDTFFWRAWDSASAFLRRADRAVLERAWRALAASRDQANVKRASADRFMSRAIVTTRAGRIISQAECRAAADLIATDAFRQTLLALGKIDIVEPLVAPGGGLVRPGRTPAEELMGLCLFDPSARNMLLDLAAQYRNLAPFRLDLVSSDWKRPAAPVNPTITVNGTVLQHGVAGARFDPPSARILGLRALADLGAPVDVLIEADGFLPKAVQLPLSRERNYAKIGLAPEPEDESAAEKARAEAEAKAAELERQLAEARAAEQAAREAAIARAEAARRQEEEAERIAQAAAEAARQQAENPAAPVAAPIVVPPAPDPIWVETGVSGTPDPLGVSPPDEAGDVPSASDFADDLGQDSGPVSRTPDPDVAVGSDPTDLQELGGSQPTTDLAGVDELGTQDDASSDTSTGNAQQEASGNTDPSEGSAPPADSQQAAIDAVGEAAPGLGTQVPLSGIPGQVWLGDRLVISAQWTEPAPDGAPAAGSAECDPSSPFSECEVTPHGAESASVYIGAADDTEDLGPPVPPPAATEFVWQGSEGVRFDPPTTSVPQVTVRFERPGEAKLWAQIVRDGKTVAEGTQLTVQVGVPSISLEFDPATGAAAGAEVTARIVTSPPLDEDLFSVSWPAPATSNRLHLDGTGAAIQFTGAAEEVIAFEADLLTAFWADDIGTITGSYAMSGGAVRVTARARGPAPQIWDPVAGELVDVPPGRWLTGQQITLEAELAGQSSGEVRWDWQVNAGTTLSNSLSRTPTVSRSEPGSLLAEVVARDRDDRELGRGTISLSVTQAPEVPARPDPAPSPQTQTPAPPSASSAAPENAATPAETSATNAPVAPSASPPVASAVPQTDAAPSATASASPAPAVTATPKVTAAEPRVTPSAPPPATAGAAPNPPAPVACSEPDAAKAAWDYGLRAVAEGDSAAGLAALERSLALCPDAGRTAQVDALRARLAQSALITTSPPQVQTLPQNPAAVDPCAPGQPDYNATAQAWRDGLASIGAGQNADGLALLDDALALCPNQVRADQVAQLRSQLAVQAETQNPKPALGGIDAAAAAARSACAPGGTKAIEVEAEILAANRALDSGDLAAARAAMARAQALCPDPDRAKVISEIDTALIKASPPPPVSSATAPPVAQSTPQPVPVPASRTEHFGQGELKLNGYGTLTGYVVALTIADGHVTGRVDGSHDNIPMTLQFSGPAQNGVFDLPISGQLHDGDYGRQSVEGRIEGVTGPDAIVGEWYAMIDGGRLQGTWRAIRE